MKRQLDYIYYLLFSIQDDQNRTFSKISPQLSETKNYLVFLDFEVRVVWKNFVHLNYYNMLLRITINFVSPWIRFQEFQFTEHLQSSTVPEC